HRRNTRNPNSKRRRCANGGKQEPTNISRRSGRRVGVDPAPLRGVRYTSPREGIPHEAQPGVVGIMPGLASEHKSYAWET
ncbi:MAG: hypothetical protein OXG99_03675, partial [Alphaproteobacteria bacterium]|nr:hypothetical protein [Alphaproteobacteria bacterium]